MPKEKLKFNREKFEQVLHYIINKCGNKENIGKVAIFKLLYFSDFNFYESYEKPITNETYVKLPLGPAPVHFDKITEKMVSEGKIKRIKRKFKGKTQYAFISQQGPDLSKLTAPEIKTIDTVIDLLSSMNAT